MDPECQGTAELTSLTSSMSANAVAREAEISPGRSAAPGCVLKPAVVFGRPERRLAANAVSEFRCQRSVVPTVSPLLALAGGLPAVDVVSVAPSVEFEAMDRQHGAADRSLQEPQAETPPAISPGFEAETAPQRLEVICGTLRGTFVVEENRVIVQENGSMTREISPNEMERLGGRAHTKKWKQSIKVVNPDGSIGRSIGEWLRQQGLEVPRAAVCSVFPVIRDSTPGRRANHQDCQVPSDCDLGAAKEAMESHLSSLHLGLRPGDPSIVDLPDQLPVPSIVGNHREVSRMIDLRQMSFQQLLVLARANGNSDGGVQSTLLPNPPGIQPGRGAFVSGQQGSKRLDMYELGAEGQALWGEYLAGERSSPPWEALVADKPPTTAEQGVDLRQLYDLVRKAGGYEEVTSNHSWASIAKSLHLGDEASDEVASFIRSVYHRFLLRAERQDGAGGAHRTGHGMAASLASGRLGDSEEDGVCVDAEEENGKGGIGENRVVEAAADDGGKPNGGMGDSEKMVLQCA